MSRLLFTLLILCPFLAQAQNYNCLQSNTRQYFINDNFYLRGIEIDSVRTNGTDTIYYPFKTYAASCASCNTGCWLGGKVIKKSDGTFLFNTVHEDTVVIKTQALPGDTWVFYNDTSVKYYEASVVSVDTMTFAGIVDSVKRIKINAYNAGVPDLADSLNNSEFYLSKDHGFVRIFSIYFFPYLFPSIDPFVMRGANGLFNLTDYHNPTRLEIYNYEPGDVILTSGNTSISTDYWKNYVDYDSVIAKDIIDAYHTQYTISKWTVGTYTHTWSTGMSSSNYYGGSTYHLVADTSVLMPRTMPESLVDHYMDYHYYPKDTTHCILGKRYAAKLYIELEGSPYSYSFKTELGRTSFDSAHGISIDPSNVTWYRSEIIGSIKHGLPCGNTTKPNFVTPLNTLPGLEIFPNPVSERLTISAPVILSSIVIYDIPGRVIFSNVYNAQTVEIDISRLHTGLYFLKINDTEVRKILKQ